MMISFHTGICLNLFVKGARRKMRNPRAGLFGLMAIFLLVSVNAGCQPAPTPTPTPTPTPAPTEIQANFILEILKQNPSAFATSYANKEVLLSTPEVVAVQAYEGALGWSVLMGLDSEERSRNTRLTSVTRVEMDVYQVRAEVSGTTAASIAEGEPFSIICQFMADIERDSAAENPSTHLAIRNTFKRVYCLEVNK